MRKGRYQVTTVATAPILALREIRKAFGAVNVLKGVDLTLFPGTVTALVGDNGAGKSTLIKSIAGIYSIDGGELSWEGSKRTLRSPNDATTLGIEVVYQDLALCDNLDIAANMFLGREEMRGVVLDELEIDPRRSHQELRIRAGRGLLAMVDGRQSVLFAEVHHARPPAALPSWIRCAPPCSPTARRGCS